MQLKWVFVISFKNRGKSPDIEENPPISIWLKIRTKTELMSYVQNCNTGEKNNQKEIEITRTGFRRLKYNFASWIEEVEKTD